MKKQSVVIGQKLEVSERKYGVLPSMQKRKAFLFNVRVSWTESGNVNRSLYFDGVVVYTGAERNHSRR